jgi:hypothetical protein
MNSHHWRRATSLTVATATLSLCVHLMLTGREQMPKPQQLLPQDLGPVGIAPMIGDSVYAPAAPFGEVERSTTTQAQRHSAVAVFGHTATSLGASMQCQALVDRGIELMSSTATDRDAIEFLHMGRTEFAVVGTQLSPDDLASGLQATTIGAEVWALAVPQESPLESLSAPLVRKVITGQARDWREIGLNLGAIALAVPMAQDVGERAARALVGGDPFAADAARLAGDDAVLAHVLSAPGAVGVVRVGAVGEHRGVRLLRIDGVEATPEEYTNGRYRAVVPLVVATVGPAQGAAALYIEAMRKESARSGTTLLH